MFEDFYYNFLASVTEPNFYHKNGRIMLDEIKLKEQMHQLFNIITKSKDYVLRSLSVVNSVKINDDANLGKLHDRLIALRKKLRNVRMKGRAPIQTRHTSRNTSNKSSSIPVKETKAPSYSNRGMSKPAPERSKTPEFNTNQGFGRDRVSNTRRVKSPNATGFPLVSTKNKGSNGSNVTDKTNKSKSPSKYSNHSPVRAKPVVTNKIQGNKKFLLTKLSDSQNEQTGAKSKQQCSPTVTNNVKQKDSKSSLSNNGRLNSLYELNHKTTLEKIKLNKASNIDNNESFKAVQNSINQFKKTLKVSRAYERSTSAKKVSISYNDVLDKFLEKLDKKTTTKKFTEANAEDSDLLELNPLEL